mmetsp:Transcript_123923/g.185247  ORF Transcript_123923/g.185247 Transcript_123923/m.185247 type:complete len:230 (-) Transcript_123923:40-729(-)
MAKEVPVPGLVSRIGATLVNQGAEGRIFSGVFLDQPTIIKERFKKSYRHPVLDEKITAKRITQEVRALVKCRKSGIDVPTLYFTDLKNGLLLIEQVNGITVRETFCKDAAPWNEQSRTVATNVGKILARLHENGIIHGDLTTSNMMIRQDSFDITLIDFGLSTNSSLTEDRAVDLYVLERALISTHINSEDLFALVIEGYKSHAPKKNNATISKLDEVRMRGRKKLAFG